MKLLEVMWTVDRFTLKNNILCLNWSLSFNLAKTKFTISHFL